MTQLRSRRNAIALLVLSLVVAPRQHARADEGGAHSSLSLQLQLHAGAGVHSSSLPGVNGPRRVDAAWFPAAGARVLCSQSISRPLRFGAEISYLTSTAFEVTRPIAPNTVEQGSARAQALSVLGRVAVALDQRAQPVLLPINLGYAFDAFTTATPLTAAQSYMLSGPRLALGIEVPLWSNQLWLAARAELGANLTESAALRGAGVSALGVQYALEAAAEAQLTSMLRLGVSFRQANVRLPLSGEGSFHEQRRFLLANLTLRSRR